MRRNKIYIKNIFLLVLKSKANQVHIFLTILNSITTSLTSMKNLSTNGQLWTYFYQPLLEAKDIVSVHNSIKVVADDEK